MLILLLEICVTICGIILLFRAKSWGKGSVKHPHYRYLGAFLITILPALFVTATTLGIVWSATHPGLTEQQFHESVRWPAAGVDALIAFSYSGIAIMWDKSIKRRALAAAPQVSTPDSMNVTM